MLAKEEQNITMPSFGFVPQFAETSFFDGMCVFPALGKIILYFSKAWFVRTWSK